MSDVDGEYAFDRVLDQLIDARVELKTAQAEARDAASKVRDAESLVSTAQRATATLKADRDKALPILKELYEAAEALAIQAKDSASPGVAATAERVLASLKPAHVYCDQEIPF